MCRSRVSDGDLWFGRVRRTQENATTQPDRGLKSTKMIVSWWMEQVRLPALADCLLMRIDCLMCGVVLLHSCTASSRATHLSFMVRVSGRGCPSLLSANRAVRTGDRQVPDIIIRLYASHHRLVHTAETRPQMPTCTGQVVKRRVVAGDTSGAAQGWMSVRCSLVRGSQCHNMSSMFAAGTQKVIITACKQKVSYR